MYELIPDELKKLKRWVCWRLIENPDAKPNSHSRFTKVPYNPERGWKASSTDPATWADFDTAVGAVQAGEFAGIGFMFLGSGYFGIDIDDRPDEMKKFLSGEHDNIFGEMVDSLRSYAEISQSGNGIHIICKGVLPDKDFKNPDHKVEMYAKARYFCMTGNFCGDFADIADCTETVKPFYERYKTKKDKPESAPPPPPAPVSLDVHSIIEKAMNSKGGDKFRRLYNGNIQDYTSASEADLAFCNMLAFWCGGDTAKMDEIFRSSGLYREKWDRKQSGSTYGKLTLQKAANGCNAHYDPNRREQSGAKITIKSGGTQTEETTSGKLYKFDDSGNAERMNDAFGEVLKWSYVEKKWLFYEGGKWHYDDIGYHRHIADAVVAMIEQDYPLYQDDPDTEKAFMKHLKRSRSFSGKTNMIREYEHYSPILPRMLDKHKMLLNCKNGTLNLKTGELSPHDRGNFMTKQIPVNYNPDAPEPKLWLKFLDDIFRSDPYMIRYIQKCCGYSLSGSTEEQCLFFLHGSGGNGKSVFLEIIRYILGDYATNIQPQTIMMQNRSGSSPNGDIARLKGARLVTSVEPNEGAWLDEGLVKQLTGDDVVTARKMFSDEFEFKPEFKLWMATNHKPRIKGTDNGIWRRIHLIPFTVQIPPEKMDKHLKYKLVQEAESILKWIIDGCLLWQNEGLTMPKAVKDATQEYRNEMDTLGAFLEACCIEGQGEVKASALYSVYAKWADENNEYKLSNTKFGNEMVKRFQKVRTKKGIVYKGLTLDKNA